MKKQITQLKIVQLTIVVLALAAISFAQDSAEHKMVAPEAIQWRATGPGQEMAVMSGNPLKEGEPFVLRIKFVAGSKVPPHWHPIDEHLTVIKGSFFMGKGEKFDEAAGHVMTAGAYMMMPKKTPHFAWTKEETIIQLHGIGPFKTFWINPADDPAKKASSN